jgi:hypothetical protein
MRGELRLSHQAVVLAMIILECDGSYSQPLEVDYGETSDFQSLPIYYEPTSSSTNEEEGRGGAAALYFVAMIILETHLVSYSQPLEVEYGETPDVKRLPIYYEPK